MPKCKLCGMEYKFISESHLRSKHNITTAEYKKLFPNCELCSDELKKFSSEKCKQQIKEGTFGFQKNHKINEGKEPWNKGMTKDTNNSGKKYSDKVVGRTFSYTHKKNLSEARKKFFKEHPEAIPKGEKNGMYGKKLSPEHLQALWSIYQKQNKPEKAAEKILCQFGFSYVGDRNFWVTFKNGKHKCPDFVNKSMRMVVEIYGDYWHKNDNPQEIIDLYAEIGWKCFVFWEHEVYNYTLNPDTFAQLIDEFEMEDFTYEDFDGKWML